MGGAAAGVVLALFVAGILEALWGMFTGFPFLLPFLYVLIFFGAVLQAYVGDRWAVSPFIISVLLSALAVFLYLTQVGGYSGSVSELAGWWFVSVVLGTAVAFLIPIYVVIGIRTIAEHPTYRQWFSFGRGGGARWASLYTYDNLPRKGAIFLGSTLVQDTLFKKNVGLPYEDDAHFLTIAQTGAGKSVTALWPTIKDYKGPMVVLDPKGEHAEFVERAAFRERKQQQNFSLDPFDKTVGGEKVRYNPLSEIDIASPHARAFLTAISNACVFEEKGDNVHFSESAKTIIEGVIVHVLTTLPKYQQNLPKVADMFRGYDPTAGVSNPKIFDGVIADMSTNDAAGGVAMDAANLLLAAGDRERGSMLTTCFRSLKWTTDPSMRTHLEGSPLPYRPLLSDLVRSGQGGTDGQRLFVVLPFEYMDKSSQIRWMRVMINLINVHLFQNPRGDNTKVLFVLDEFFKLGYMPSIEEGIVTARGAGAKYWILLQNIGQLKELYNKNWETFVSSSNVQLFGVSDGETAKWAAAATGGDKDKDTASYPLLRPDEIRQFLGKDLPTQIVIPVNGAPMRLERLAFKPLKQYRGL